MVKQEILRVREKLDCWHSNNRTALESTQFKDSLVEYYNRLGTTPNTLRCMVTNQEYPRNEVRAAHLVKRSTQGDTMHLYGLSPNINNPRNGILLIEPIELAFDRKDICFLYDPLSHQLTVRVLNPSLTGHLTSTSRTVYPTTYSDLEGLPLQLPPDVFPYRRVLSMHAKFAYSRALNMNWIANTETLDTYFNLSDAGLQEPTGLGELSWSEVHTAIHRTV